MVGQNVIDQFKSSIDKDSSTPVYLQIKKTLIEMINKEEVHPGEMLPTGADLCDLLEVSRSPIRNAFSELEKEGYITRIQGKGTFVSEHSNRVRPGLSNVVGCIVPNIDSSYSANLVKGIEVELSKKGYSLLLGLSAEHREVEKKIIQRFRNTGIKGLILFPTNCAGYKEDSELKGFVNDGGQLVLLDRKPDNGEFSYVGSDNFGGAYTCTRHLSIHGYENIAFCAENLDISAVVERLSGFKKGAENYHLNIINKLFTLPDIEESEDTCYLPQVFLDNIDILKEKAPVGICAENDGTAIFLQKQLENVGLKIGVDFGIIGFENSRKAKYQIPKLTSVSQNGLLMGDTAAKMIVDSIENNSKDVRIHIVPTQLYIRQSCKIIEGET